jgi:hypothetical protein
MAAVAETAAAPCFTPSLSTQTTALQSTASTGTTTTTITTTGAAAVAASAVVETAAVPSSTPTLRTPTTLVQSTASTGTGTTTIATTAAAGSGGYHGRGDSSRSLLHASHSGYRGASGEVDGSGDRVAAISATADDMNQEVDSMSGDTADN